MGYMGLLDAGIAALIGQRVQEQYDRDVEFRWHIASMQLHCFKTLPFIFSQLDLFGQLQQLTADYRGNDPDKRKPLDEGVPPTWRNIVKWYAKILDAYDEHGPEMLDLEKYGPFRRIKRRWLEHMGYVDSPKPPPVQLSTLDFSKAE